VRGCVILLLSSTAHARDWSEAFSPHGGPKTLELQALYTDDAGHEHKLHLWRDGERRLRRKTDESLDLYVEKSTNGEYAYRLVDHGRKLIISADRSNLFRFGIFTDWAGLSRVVVRPKGTVAVHSLDRKGELPGLGACRWFSVVDKVRHEEVCWSSKWGVPLMIERVEKTGHTRVFSALSVATLTSRSAFELGPASRYTSLDADAALKQ
jgi:hypothetical protein